MNEGTWPNTMTSGFDTRERNQQGEHELAVGSVCQWNRRLCRACNTWSSACCYKKRKLDGYNFWERHFEVRWVWKPNRVGVVMLSVHAFASPLTSSTKLAAASFSIASFSDSLSSSSTYCAANVLFKLKGVCVTQADIARSRMWGVYFESACRKCACNSTTSDNGRAPTMLRWQLIFCTHSWAVNKACHSHLGFLV